ncbi:hypothetical protein EBO34_14230 [Alteribacter keqinensis]|uniref:Uncharacterized protein n=1 Tax=Alteribacter keqinensis TaxID=2483800 RepID=A0A3M7TQD2_9BACI|nr:hypothetical protein EBO34_14230 [Alteribacter keqinensis]
MASLAARLTGNPPLSLQNTAAASLIASENGKVKFDLHSFAMAPLAARLTGNAPLSLQNTAAASLIASENGKVKFDLPVFLLHFLGCGYAD